MVSTFHIFVTKQKNIQTNSEQLHFHFSFAWFWVENQKCAHQEMCGISQGIQWCIVWGYSMNVERGIICFHHGNSLSWLLIVNGPTAWPPSILVLHACANKGTQTQQMHLLWRSVPCTIYHLFSSNTYTYLSSCSIQYLSHCWHDFHICMQEWHCRGGHHF
jgi:hypothetical protein